MNLKIIDSGCEEEGAIFGKMVAPRKLISILYFT